MYKPVDLRLSVWTTFRLSFLMKFSEALAWPKKSWKMSEKLRVCLQFFFASLWSRRFNDFIAYFTLWKADRSLNYTPVKISIHHTEKASNLYQIAPTYSPKCFVQIFINIKGWLVGLTTLIAQFIRTIVCRGTRKLAEEHKILGSTTDLVVWPLMIAHFWSRDMDSLFFITSS